MNFHGIYKSISHLKVLLIMTVFTMCCLVTRAQDNNVLDTNTSPVFILMGISPTEISNPSDLGDFTTSLQNATGNFNSLPSSYAVEIFPHKILKADFQYDLKNGTYLHKVYSRSSFSVGYNADNIVPESGQMYSRIGFGFKTSLIHSDPGKKLTNRDLKKIRDNQHQVNALKANAVPNAIDQTILQDPNAALIFNTLDIAPYLKRTGGFLDLAMAFGYDFTGENADQMDYSRFGIWLTGGLISKSNNDEISIDALGTVRYMNNLETQYFMADSLSGRNAQFGAKLNFNALEGDFQLSAEYIYQNSFEEGDMNTDKYVFNTSYEISDNIKLGFTIGKNFDNSRTQEGNLISIINFISSFGTRD